jgi:hypothetical protein
MFQQKSHDPAVSIRDIRARRLFYAVWRVFWWWWRLLRRWVLLPLISDHF